MQRGDVVMYNTPLRAEGTAVKRVIALGGDTVFLDERRAPGKDEDGEVRGGERTAAKGWEVMENGGKGFRVPYGHVWCEGDNWRASLDSNFYGPMSRSLIVGRAVGVVWPPERWGRPWDGEGNNEKQVWGRTRVIEGVERVPVEWVDLVEGTGG